MHAAFTSVFQSEHEDVVLATVAGYVDTLGFVALFGMFTAHVTGNFVLIGADLVTQGQGVLLKLLAFPAFVLGIVLSFLAIKILPVAQRRFSERVLFLLQAVLLSLFLWVGQCARPITDATTWLVLWCGMIGACAMGVQNAHAKLVARAGMANTVMTGNVTQAVIDVMALFVVRDSADARPALVKRLAKTSATVLGFAVGAVAGALLYHSLAFWALIPAILAIFAMAMRAPRL